MTNRPQPLLLFFILFLAGLAFSCAPARHPVFRTFLLPSSGAPALQMEDPPSPPRLDLYARESPEIFGDSAQPHQPATASAFMRRADLSFENGKRFYRSGDMDAARREFDTAIEALLAAPRTGVYVAVLDRKLREMADAIHQYDISGLGAGRPEGEEAIEPTPFEEMPEPTFPTDPKLRNLVMEELKTTVSALPLELNDDILSYINYFSSTRGRKVLISGLRQAGKYRPLIRRIFDEEGIPQELVHLAQAESAFNTRAVSRAKAAGMWQFIASRGLEYGLTRTKAADERYDPEKSTRAAAKHLRDLYTEFGDWYLAMAAYNCGPVNVQRAVARTGYADVWELRRRNALPRETSSYVPIILAMVIMAKNPSHYGLDSVEPADPVEYDTLILEADTHLDLVADITEQPVSELRALNPALLTNIAPQGYALHVPVGRGVSVASALEAIPEASRAAWRLHRILDGDTLSGIARRYNTTTERLISVNCESAMEMTPGSLLIVPAAPAKLAKTTARRAAPKRAASVTSATAAAAAKKRTTSTTTASTAKKATPSVAAKDSAPTGAARKADSASAAKKTPAAKPQTGKAVAAASVATAVPVKAATTASRRLPSALASGPVAR
jgi:membrane-bound lytic murein transglycosylase D